MKSVERLSVPVNMKWLGKHVAECIEALPVLLQEDPERARLYILKHVTEISMHPTEENGRHFYVAEGEWFMPENESVAGALLNGDANTLRMVAGEGFEPSTFGL